MAGVVERIRAGCRTFDFFQAVKLLEEYFRGRTGSEQPLAEGAIRFSSDPSMTFPASDLADLRGGDEAVELVASFMGLTGCSSPLPGYFVEHAARSTGEDESLSDFLAIFNNRIYALLYDSWKKHRITAGRNGRPAGIAARLLELAGGEPGGWDPHRVACAGLLARNAHSAEGLEQLLSHCLDGTAVRVLEHEPRRVAVDRRPRLGEARLGVNALTGDSVLSRSARFRVVVGPVGRPRFEQLRPGTTAHARIRSLVREFLSDPLDFDVDVVLASDELVPVRLGDEGARLGRTAVLGIRPRSRSRTHRRAKQYD
jgi:type VI secretion system protein ImpH